MKGEYKRPVILLAILLVCFVGSKVSGELLAWWDFDYGGTDDRYGGNNGVSRGDLKWVSGRSDKGDALSLTGGGYVTIHDESHFDITEQITVAAWIKVNSFDVAWQAIVTKGASAWALVRNGKTNAARFKCQGIEGEVEDPTKGRRKTLAVAGTVNVNNGKWHHVAGVYDGSKICLYVDGVLDKSLAASGTIATNDHKVGIGENTETMKRSFNGLIDDVVIFDHALGPNEIARLCKQGCEAFVPKGNMARLVEATQTAVERLEPEQAITLIEKEIAECQRREPNNAGHASVLERHLSPDMYFLLAKSKEAAGLPKHEIVPAYKLAVSKVPHRTSYVPNALLWLFANIPSKDFLIVVGHFVRNSDVLAYDICNVSKNFQSSGNWAAFKSFLDGLFASVDSAGEPTYRYARTIARVLEQDSVWAASFMEYCRDEANLMKYLLKDQEELAGKYVAQKQYNEAVEAYRDMINKCGANQLRTEYHLTLCECFFNSGQYGGTVAELNSLIESNKFISRELLSRAIMLQGQAYIQLGDVDKAVSVFLDHLAEYPDVKSSADVNFFVGYCYMLQGRYEEATEAFNLIVKDYPKSKYVGEAHQCLSRIKDMAQ